MLMQILNLPLVQGQVSKLSLSVKLQNINGVLGIYTSNHNSEDTVANMPNNLGVDSRVDQDIATAEDNDAMTVGKEGANAMPLGVDSWMDQDIATAKDDDAMTIRKEGTGATPLAMPPENQDGTMGVKTDDDIPHLTHLLDQKDWSDDDNDDDYEEGQEESSDEEEDGEEEEEVGEEEDREEEEEEGGERTEEERCDIIGKLAS